MNTWKKCLIGALLACMPLVMVGCGSDDVAAPVPAPAPEPTPTPTPTPTLKEITGKAVLGPISSARVNVYGVDAKGKKIDTPLNSSPAITDSKGNYKISIPQGSTGTVIFEVVGGKYKDEATGTTKDNTTLSSAVSEIGTATTVAVTAITDLSVKLVQKNYSSGGFTPKNVLSGDIAVKTLLSLPADLNITTTLPVPAAEVTSAATSLQLAYMSAVGTMSELQKVNVATTTDSIAEALTAATRTGGSTAALSTILSSLKTAFDSAVLKITTIISNLPGAAALTVQQASISSIASTTIKTDVTQITTAIKEGVAAAALDTVSPTVPTGLKATTVNFNSVTLTWTASTDPANTDGKPGSGVTGYKIFRDNTLLTTTSAANYTDESVTGNKTYSYTVLALDKTGNSSAKSAALSVTTPVGLTISVSGNVKP